MKPLHVVAFNVPYPADYGGVIDIYYKLVALKNAGIPVKLHCFEYGRGKSDVLNEVCSEVNYYKVNKSAHYLIDSNPHSVSTRTSKQLFENLKKDTFPILFEGIETTSCLKSIAQSGRKIVIRAHNIEHDYYKGLYHSETNLIKKIYLYSESVKLKKYEKNLRLASGIAAISPSDYLYFSHLYDKVVYIPAFHPYNEINTTAGLGQYALFHGNLEVADNEKAAIYLIENVFAHMNFPLIIAGKKPSEEIYKAAEINNHIKVVASPEPAEMNALITHSQMNILLTFQSTGLKLKLLASLFGGRHCIVNNAMIENTGLGQLCHVMNSSEDIKTAVNQLMHTPFSDSDVAKRRCVLQEALSNAKNAEKIIKMLY